MGYLLSIICREINLVLYFAASIWLLLPSTLMAQTEVVEIVKAYQEMQVKAEAGKLLEDFFVQNPSSLTDRSGVVFQQKERYYYENTTSQTKQLRLVVLQVNANGWQYEQQFFYNQTGDFCLFNEKQNHAEVEYRTLEVIFLGNEPRRLRQDEVTINSSTVKYSNKLSQAYQTAQYLKEKFAAYQKRFERYPFEENK